MSADATRLSGLDGVRGAAAIVVVLHHALVTAPILAGAYFGEAVPEGARWFVYSPLHLLWDGSGPVYIFFVLSGLVVALPFLRGGGQPWAAFYPRRLLRLYLPVWAAVLLAYALIALVPRAAAASRGPWMQQHDVSITATHLLRDGVLLTGTSWADGPLWSLQWEVVFSLLLPLYVLAGRLARRSGVAAGALLIVALVAVQVGGDGRVAALIYLPMFLIGVVLAARLEQLTAFGVRADSLRWGSLLWLGVFVAALLLLSSRWWIEPMDSAIAHRSAYGPTLVGAVMLVILVSSSAGARQLASSRPALAAGRLSFSLYLVHDPVIVSVVLLFPASSNGLPQAIGVVAAVAVALLFERFVERPSHRFARHVGARTMTARRSRVGGSLPAITS